MSFATSLDLILRGGALSLCAIIAVHMLRQKPVSIIGPICCVFNICAAG